MILAFHEGPPQVGRGLSQRSESATPSDLSFINLFVYTPNRPSQISRNLGGTLTDRWFRQLERLSSG